MAFSHTETAKQLTVLAENLPDFPLDRTLTFRMVRLAAERLGTNLNQCLKVEGITENLWFALLSLYAAPNRETLPSRLSDLLCLTRTSATRLSDDMVAHGWVERGGNAQDRRQTVLKLTEEGEAFIRRMQPEITEKRSPIWAGFDEADHRELQRLLGKLLDNLESQNAEAQEGQEEAEN